MGLATSLLDYDLKKIMVGQILMQKTQKNNYNSILEMDWTFVKPRAQKAMIDLKTFCHDVFIKFR
jgi:hypothetical protein